MTDQGGKNIDDCSCWNSYFSVSLFSRKEL